MKKILRPYQQAAIDSVFDWYASGKKGHPLVVAPVGAGKSLLIAEFIRRVQDTAPRAKIVVLAHVMELLTQNADELKSHHPSCDFGFYSAGLGQKRLHHDVTFAGIQSVCKKAGAFPKPPDIVIIDECFTGETLIKTTHGQKRLDEVRLGDIVYSATGCGEVSAISKRVANIIYNVRLSNGKEIRCTGNHPFFTERGWVECKNLVIRERLFEFQNMPELWERFLSQDKAKFLQVKVLLNILLKEDGKRHVGSRREGENARDPKENRAQAICSWWERQKINETTRNDFRNSGGCVDTRICDSNWGPEKIKNIPNLLQSGSGEQREKTSDRAGRPISLRQTPDARQKEGRILDVVRVESVEIEKRGRGEFVYNLQIDGHPSYFANGILVHNCHLISHNDQTTYRKFITDCEALNPNLCVIGFTGTPFRADTGRLEEGEGKLFDGVAYEISMGFMIEQGYWAKPITAKTDYTMDVSGVGKRGGDYIISQLEEKVDTDEVTLACVVRMLDCCADRNRVLVFTAGVQHCEHVRDALRAAGQFAEMVTGETPKEEREGIIKRFKAGDFKYLVNVAVLTTGFNVPEIDALVFMRPTQSPVLYIQCVGRGVRTVYAQGQFDLGTTEGRLASIAASGKKDCLVVDFGGVVDRLGPIDAVEIRKSNRVKNEDEPAGEAILKRCPSCGEMCAAAQRYCYSCSYSFIQQALDPNLKNTEITTIDEAPEWHEVMGVSYNKHEKNGKPPSMAVSYATMNGPFREWICFEHEGYARDKARAWFQMRLPGAKVPDTVSEALAHKYQVPHRICVKRDGKFFRIVDFDWTVKPRDKPVVEDLDDYDIPF